MIVQRRKATVANSLDPQLHVWRKDWVNRAPADPSITVRFCPACGLYMLPDLEYLQAEATAKAKGEPMVHMCPGNNYLVAITVLR